MDAFTHGLASYSLTRAIFPRATGVTVISAICAGMAADLDGLSRYGSAATFLTWNRTYLHSIAGALVIAMVFAGATVIANSGRAKKDSPRTVVASLLLVGVLHLAMDVTQNEGVELLWPFGTRRYSADWVAHFDLWILLMLLAGVLMPLLLALVTEEIGAKSKSPRGRIGAGLALAAMCVYIGGRALLHGNAVAMLEARTYRGETARRVAALAESDSPLHWRGVAETERALHEFDLDLLSTNLFNPDAGVTSYKPEASPALEAARGTEAATKFLAVARFPRASVEKTTSGYRVEIRDFGYVEGPNGGREVIAVVETDAGAKVLSEELSWRGK